MFNKLVNGKTHLCPADLEPVPLPQAHGLLTNKLPLACGRLATLSDEELDWVERVGPVLVRDAPVKPGTGDLGFLRGRPGFLLGRLIATLDPSTSIGSWRA